MTEAPWFSPGESDRTARLLASKPERVFPFDRDELDRLRSIPDLVIGEIAGADSIAAILTAMEEDDVGTVLPIAVYTGTESGDWEGFHRNAAFLRKESAARTGKEVLPLTWMGAPRLWHSLVGRYVTELAERFGRYSPCPICHFFIHAVRIPVARRLGVTIVIGGDRERHDGLQKIDQLPDVIEATGRFFERFGMDLRQPLRETGKGDAVTEILGADWPGGSPQPVCCFSRNYLAADGSALWRDEEVMAMINGYVIPVLDRVITGYIDHDEVDYDRIVRDVLLNG